jgi:hypothetical protein
MEDQTYETRKQKIKSGSKKNKQIYSQKHVRMQEKIKESKQRQKKK